MSHASTHVAIIISKAIISKPDSVIPSVINMTISHLDLDYCLVFGIFAK